MRHVKLRPETRTDVAALNRLIELAYHDIKAQVEHGELPRFSGCNLATARLLDGGDVDFPHRHHGLKGSLSLRTASRKRVG